MVAVRGEGDVGDPVLVAAKSLHFLGLVAFDLPELDRLVGAAGDEVLIVVDGDQLLGGVGVPDLDGAIGAAGDDPLAVGREVEGSNCTGMPCADAQRFAVGGVEDADYLVAARGGDELAVGAELGSGDGGG